MAYLMICLIMMFFGVEWRRCVPGCVTVSGGLVFGVDRSLRG